MKSMPFHRHALRTAAIAVALVGVILTALLTATDLLVQRSLSDSVIHRLEEGLDRIDPAAFAVSQRLRPPIATSTSPSWPGCCAPMAQPWLRLERRLYPSLATQ